jgi:hypothetical protein
VAPYPRAPGYELLSAISVSGDRRRRALPECVMPRPGDSLLRALGRTVNMGIVVGISQFLSFPAPAIISSRCSKAPGCGLVFGIPGSHDCHIHMLGRSVNRGQTLLCAPGQ